MCTQEEMMESSNKVGRQSFRRRFHTPSYLRSVRHVWYNKDSELFNATGVVSFGYFRPLPFIFIKWRRFIFDFNDFG